MILSCIDGHALKSLSQRRDTSGATMAQFSHYGSRQQPAAAGRFAVPWCCAGQDCRMTGTSNRGPLEMRRRLREPSASPDGRRTDMMRQWYLLLMPLLATLLSTGCDTLNPDRKHERRLQPAIAFVERTLAELGRLPTQDEFYEWRKQVPGMYVLRDRSSRYAASKGAKEVNDYMVGVWRAPTGITITSRGTRLT